MGVKWRTLNEQLARLGGGLIPKNREVDLDVVRGVAILLAMGWHLNQLTGQPIFDAIQAPGLRFGWAGVDLFFILSGFLVGRLVFREHEKYGFFDYSRFFARRALKLWPILYIYLVFAVLFSGDTWWTFAPQIGLHVQNFFIPTQAHHLWSLAVEEHFYLAAGLLLPLAMRRMSTNSISIVLVSLILFSTAARFSGAALGATPNMLQVQTQYRIDGLSAGVLLALMSVRRPQFVERLLRAKWLWAIMVGFGVAWLSLVPKDTWLGSTIGFSISWLTGLFFLLLVYKSGIERWARLPSIGLAFLGAYSYSLYIWHVAIARTLSGKMGALPGPIHVATVYVAAICFAVFVTVAIERPVLALRDRWMASKL